jgi:hypothetical protein
VGLTLALAAPALAVGPVIEAGIDLWRTPGNGGTRTDFASDPIPAGFFCDGSEPFAGVVAFRGVPLGGALGATDTIVERFDDAVFDARGMATTRIQVRAMAFEGIAPVETRCGRYGVTARLAGGQPVTTMRILREHEHGGHFLAPIAVRVKVTFRPLEPGSGKTVSVVRKLRFAPSPTAQWSDRAAPAGREVAGPVEVAGLTLPGTTANFAAGWRARGEAAEVVAIIHCADPTCTKAHETVPIE